MPEVLLSRRISFRQDGRHGLATVRVMTHPCEPMRGTRMHHRVLTLWGHEGDTSFFDLSSCGVVGEGGLVLRPPPAMFSNVHQPRGATPLVSASS